MFTPSSQQKRESGTEVNTKTVAWKEEPSTEHEELPAEERSKSQHQVDQEMVNWLSHLEEILLRGSEATEHARSGCDKGEDGVKRSGTGTRKIWERQNSTGKICRSYFVTSDIVITDATQGFTICRNKFIDQIGNSLTNVSWNAKGRDSRYDTILDYKIVTRVLACDCNSNHKAMAHLGQSRTNSWGCIA